MCIAITNEGIPSLLLSPTAALAANTQDYLTVYGVTDEPGNTRNGAVGIGTTIDAYGEPSVLTPPRSGDEAPPESPSR